MLVLRNGIKKGFRNWCRPSPVFSKILISKISTSGMEPSSERTKLSKVLSDIINASGPISLNHYMTQCLSNPDLGYYTTRDPLNSKMIGGRDTIDSDFVTSPEISSTFGEICGLWFFSMFLTHLKQIDVKEKELATLQKNSIQEKTKKFNVHEKTIRVIEFGPGRGTLMFDMLRTLNKLVGKKNKIEIVMVEVSEVLKNEQHKMLCSDGGSKLDPILGNSKTPQGLYKSTTNWNNKITWINNEHDLREMIEKEIPQQYINFVMAHEFFDALPIAKFNKTSKGWREYLVDNYDNQKTELPNVTKYTSDSLSGKSAEKEFNLVLSPHATPYCAVLNTMERYSNLPINSNVEISFKSYDYASIIGKLVTNPLENGYQAGAGLIIDYGPTDSIPTDTLRGIAKHAIVDPFCNPGSVDLSSDVDFTNLRELFKDKFNCKTYTEEQGDWLDTMGLKFRLEQLLESEYDSLITPDETEDPDTELFEKKYKEILKSYERLTGKGIRDMGSVYKVMGVVPKDLDILPVGFGGDI